MDKKNIISFIYKGTEITLNVAGIITGNIPIQLLAVILSSVESLMDGRELINTEVSEKLEKQLADVIRKTFEECEKEFGNQYIGKVLVLLRPYIEYYEYDEIGYANLKEWLKQLIKEQMKREEKHLTFEEMELILDFFFDSFKKNMLSCKELCNYKHDIQIEDLQRQTAELQIQTARDSKRIEEISEQIEKEYSGFDSCFTVGGRISISNYYMGREQEEEDIQGLMARNKYLLLSGQGGIGKTQILNSIYNIWKDKSHDNMRKVRIGYMCYSQTMDNTVYQSMSYNKTGDYKIDVESAWKKLYGIGNSCESVLFIDNMNNTISDDKSIEKLYGFHGKIVIASRCNYLPDFEMYEIKELSGDKCIELFRKEYQGMQAEQEIVRELVEAIAAKHTMTIHLLACIANDNMWSLEELSLNLKEKDFKLSYCNEQDDYAVLEEEYKKLFDISRLNEKEKKVLIAFSRFPYEFHNIDMLMALLSADAEIDSALFFARLYRKGWLEKSGLGYRIHPIISKSICSYTEFQVGQYGNMIEILTEKLDEAINEGYEKLMSVLILADALCVTIKKEPDDRLFVMVRKLLNIYVYMHKINRAEEIYHYLNKIALPGDMEYERELCFVKANILSEKGDYYGALEKTKEGLKYAPNDGNLLLLQAEIHSVLGQHKRAIVEYKKILDTELMLKNGFKVDKAELDMIRIKIASAFMNCEKEEEALRIVDEVRVRLEQESEHTLERARIYDEISTIYRTVEYRGKYLYQALDLAKKAKDIYKFVSGEESIQVAVSLKKIGVISYFLHQYKETEKYYKEAEKLMIQNAGNNYVRLVELYYEMGVLFIDMMQYQDAHKYLEKALEIGKMYYSVNDKRIQSIYLELGIVFARLDNKIMMKRCFEQGGYSVNIEGDFAELIGNKF